VYRSRESPSERIRRDGRHDTQVRAEGAQIQTGTNPYRLKPTEGHQARP
jgi:hypothetical protein